MARAMLYLALGTDCEMSTRTMIEEERGEFVSPVRVRPCLRSFAASIRSSPADSMLCCQELVEPGITNPKSKNHSNRRTGHGRDWPVGQGVGE